MVAICCLSNEMLEGPSRCTLHRRVERGSRSRPSADTYPMSLVALAPSPPRFRPHHFSSIAFLKHTPVLHSLALPVSRSQFLCLFPLGSSFQTIAFTPPPNKIPQHSPPAPVVTQHCYLPSSLSLTCKPSCYETMLALQIHIPFTEIPSSYPHIVVSQSNRLLSFLTFSFKTVNILRFPCRCWFLSLEGAAQ